MHYLLIKNPFSWFVLIGLVLFWSDMDARPGRTRLTKAEHKQRMILKNLKGSRDLALYNKAIIHATEIGSYVIADSLVDRARPILKSNKDSLLHYEHLRIKARLYTILNRYPSALEMFKDALLFYHRSGLWEEEGQVLVNLIEFYRSSHLFDEAIAEVELLIGHPSFEELSPKVKAGAYHRYAAVLNEDERDIDSVILMSQRSLSYSEPDSLLDPMGTSYLELGYAHAQRKESKAIYYFESAFKVFEEQGRIHYMCNSLLHIASYLMRVQSNQQALLYLDSAIAMSKPYFLPGFLNVAFEKKAKILNRIGRSEEAFLYRDSAAILDHEDALKRFSDQLAIQSRKFNTDIAESRVREWESERKKVIQQTKSQQLMQRVIVSSLVLLTIILLGLYYFFSRLKRSKEHLEESEKALFAANKELINTLKEKDGLIEEVHHRVKNNLQLITSLIRVQQFQQKDHMSEGSMQMVDDILSRVTAMAVVHEKLYSQQHISQLRAKEYFSELLGELKTLGGKLNAPLVVNIDATDEQLEVSHGIALGMICTELVSNSLKYAFDGVANPQIDIRINKTLIGEKAKVFFSYQDNGKGFKKGAKMGMGNRLILLFSRQLEGEYELISDGRFFFSLEYMEE